MASAKLMIPKRSAPYYVLTANVTVHGKRVRRYGRFDFDSTVLKTHRQRENAAIEAALVFERAEQQKPGQISLLDKYHVAEPEARSMCAAEGLLSPLYDFTKRGGCWFCPNASISELRHLYRYHPELWQLLLELQDVPNKPTERFSWRRTFREIDERFRQEGEQLSFYEER